MSCSAKEERTAEKEGVVGMRREKQVTLIIAVVATIGAGRRTS